MFLKHSQARSENGEILLLHHATRNFNFTPEDMAPVSHFGTRQAARERIFDWPEARLITALLDIRNPLEIPDINDVHTVEKFAQLIFSNPEAREKLGTEFLQNVIDAENTAGEGDEVIFDAMRKAGYDGFFYRNLHEDPGSLSWVILDPAQIHVVRDGLAKDSLDPWEHEEECFLGPAIINDIFDIDGRSEDFDGLWDYLEKFGPDLPDLKRDDQGWSARWLPDWEPMPTLGLFDPEGHACGFYMRGQAWIDLEMRGKGKSHLMIRAAADLTGGSPSMNTDGLGYSQAGYQAHLSALKKAKLEASELGYSPNFEENIHIQDIS